MDISSMLEVQVKEVTDVKENVTPGKDQASSTTTTAAASISQEESNFYKLMFGNDLASVRFRRLHCTACDMHIGSAPANIGNMFVHPVLRTLLCANCREFYGDGRFEQGDDATDMFCRWCANGGNLYCCSYCSNTFCYKCIKRNFTSLVRKKIEADEKWKCFVCNPRDLYSARALCWALLEHVQTLTRILKNDKKMSVAEIEKHMNLDESPCCPRRKKRKRRRLESKDSSEEEEDETFIPEHETNGLPIQRKQFKRLKELLKEPITKINPNGKVKPSTAVTKIQSTPIPIRPRPPSFLTGPSQSTTNSCKSINVSSESIVLPSSSVITSNTSLPSRYDSNALQPPLYHTTFMNSAGSKTYLQTSTTVNSATLNRIILPASSLSPMQSLTSYQAPSIQSSTSYQQPQSLQSSQNTMVSIPNPTDKHGKSLFLLPKPRRVDLTLTPNIIDLDSDSDDEPKIVDQQNKSTVNKDDDIDIVDISFNKVVPVALTWENSDDDGIKEEPLREMCTTLTRNVPSFSEIMFPHSQQLDKLLSDMKEKVYCFFDLNTTQDVELTAQQKIIQFCWNMRNTVLQLSNIKDRIVREYNSWSRSRKTETQAQSSIVENELASQENVEIPLDMICINDSDTESDYEGSEYRIKKPSDLVKSGSIVESLLFSKKIVVHRGTGDNNVHLSANKATQVYNISRDYEKCISYSVLTKSNDVSEMDNSVSIQMPDKNFGKYEEQFIFYLQHIEDHGIQTEEANNLADSDEIPFQELIETNSPFISHLFQNTDSPDTLSSDETKIYEQERSEKSDSSDLINAVSVITDTLKDTIDNDDQQIVNNFDSDIRIKETEAIRIQEMTLFDEKLQKTHDNTTDNTTHDNTTDNITHNNTTDNTIHDNTTDNITHDNSTDNTTHNNTTDGGMMSNEDEKLSVIVSKCTVNVEPSTSKGNEDDCTIIDD